MFSFEFHLGFSLFRYSLVYVILHIIFVNNFLFICHFSVAYYSNKHLNGAIWYNEIKKWRGTEKWWWTCKFNLYTPSYSWIWVSFRFHVPQILWAYKSYKVENLEQGILVKDELLVTIFWQLRNWFHISSIEIWRKRCFPILYSIYSLQINLHFMFHYFLWSDFVIFFLT